MHTSIFAAGLVASALAVSVPDPASSLEALRRSLAKLSPAARDTKFKNSTTIAKRFDGVTLYDGLTDSTYELEPADGVETVVGLTVVCTTCYVTADLTAELRVFNQFNASAGIGDIIDNIGEDVKNLTHSVLKDIEGDVRDGDWPVIDEDLSLDAIIDDLPDLQFTATLDNLDFYVGLTTAVNASAAYAINLYTSQSEFGLRIDDGTEIGVFVTVDLLMRADAAVSAAAGADVHVDHGFHLRIDDGIAFSIYLFDSDVSSIAVDGGRFEFLPIRVNGEVTLNAVLRVGLHAGVGIDTDSLLGLFDFVNYRAGIDTVMFVDIANLTTVVTGSTDGDATTTQNDDDSEITCSGDFAAEAVFEVGVGAGVGASVVLSDLFSWGIGPTAQLPVYYTTVGTCAGGSPTAGAPAITSAAVARRDDAASSVSSPSITTTLSSSVTYTAVGCRSTGLVNCPLSLQTTYKHKTEIVTVLTLAPGDVFAATWPASITTTDISTVRFSAASSSMLLSASGAPSLYTPPPPTPTASGASGEPTPGTPGTTTVLGHTISNRSRNIAIGVSVGVGVPLVALVVWAVVACVKKRRAQAAGLPYAPVVTEERTDGK